MLENMWSLRNGRNDWRVGDEGSLSPKRWESGSCSAKGDDENKLDQILEVLTPAQGYLMFFHNRGLTSSRLRLCLQ
jgi:hypothetical protein